MSDIDNVHQLRLVWDDEGYYATTFTCLAPTESLCHAVWPCQCESWDVAEIVDGHPVHYFEDPDAEEGRGRHVGDFDVEECNLRAWHDGTDDPVIDSAVTLGITGHWNGELGAYTFTVHPPEQQPSSLDAMMDEVFEVNSANGWFDSERRFGEDVALLHSEVSEMLEGYRRDDMANVAEEAADVLIRLLDTAKRYNIDLAAEYRRKINVNRTRGYRHGGKQL